MRPWILAALSLGGCLLAAPSAPAGFAFDLTNLPAGLSIMTGQTQSINVYVLYDGTGPNSLLSAAPALRESSTDSGSAQVLTGTGNPAPAFENSFTFIPGTAPAAAFPAETGFTNLAAINETSVDPVTLGQGINPQPPITAPNGFIFLGTFNLTATSPEGTQIVLRASARNPAGGDFLAGDGSGPLPNPLPFEVTLNVVPEPGSMALVGMAASGFGGVLWRRRRAQRTETPVEVA